MVLVGSRVSEADVLASIVRPRSMPKGGKQQIQDGSWGVPAGWDDSEVIAVRRESSTGRRREFPRRLLERLSVRLRRTIPFCLSDSLTIGGQVLSTSIESYKTNSCQSTRADVHQIVIPHAIAESLQLDGGEIKSVRVFRVCPSAIDVLHARSTGPYSLTSMMPLGSKYTEDRARSSPTNNCNGFRNVVCSNCCRNLSV